MKKPFRSALDELRYCVHRLVWSAEGEGKRVRVRADWLQELVEALAEFESEENLPPVWYDEPQEKKP